MDSSSYKVYQFKESVGTREFTVQGFIIKENEFMASTFLPNAAFKANPLYIPFIKPGLSYPNLDIITWAEANLFDLYTNGVDSQEPYIDLIAVSVDKTIVTISFDQKIDKTGSAGALKAAITFSSDGVTFSALGVSDTVGTVDGSSTDLVITFNTALSTATNKIQIAAGAVKDLKGNLNSLIVTKTLDTKPPVATFSPVDGATQIGESGIVTISFDEKVFKGTDGSILSDSDLTALLVFKKTNGAGVDVPFSAHINGAGTLITITSTSPLDDNQIYYTAILADAVRDLSGNKILLTHSSFTTLDTIVPTIVFDPADLATGVVVSKVITLTFSEAIKKADGTPIVNGDIASLVVLKSTNNAGSPVAFTGTINAGKTVISITPTVNLTATHLFYVALLNNVVEDVNGNLVPAANITFTTA